MGEKEGIQVQNKTCMHSPDASRPLPGNLLRALTAGREGTAARIAAEACGRVALIWSPVNVEVLAGRRPLRHRAGARPRGGRRSILQQLWPQRTKNAPPPIIY